MYTYYAMHEGKGRMDLLIKLRRIVFKPGCTEFPRVLMSQAVVDDLTPAARQTMNVIEKKGARFERTPYNPNWIAWKYFNCGHMAIAIVAVLGAVGDWAAYIGGTSDTRKEETAVKAASEQGCKLRDHEAKALFPHIANPYRS